MTNKTQYLKQIWMDKDTELRLNRLSEELHLFPGDVISIALRMYEMSVMPALRFDREMKLYEDASINREKLLEVLCGPNAVDV